ncbi:M3 family oligoendopeptidase [Clostridium pascui]|uniref:M3 family oligoendopeptidase n=1 Tax=Clostridium pascui TaxID=46609 RepID=UPI00195C4FA4|nr:M3 family oligoendopeptidase [Clostridium pascui]MBM7871194.1 M3 family oligoendopeptidase [Clostridium pascui]
MKFSEFKYERPNIKEIKGKFNILLEEFKNSNTFEKQNKIMENINKLRSEFESMAQIAEIRHTINTTDKFYEEEQDFLDTNMPLYEEVISDYYKALKSSKFKEELEAKWGIQLFDMAELSIKTFSTEVISDLQEENKVSSEYTKLLASAKIIFEGEERNLAQMAPFMQSKDREVRKKASEAKYKFFEEHEKEFDNIYDRLVKIRTRIAKALGYNNFVELAYDRMLRTDYNKDMVKNFRKQVEESIVPVCQELVEKQRKRLGLSNMSYYDLDFKFKTGNAKPHGDANFMVNNAKNMYNELSKETGEFFDFMVRGELLDLVAKKGKASGGYCTYISEYKAPFIFSNFNGTSGDVDVLTHEAGHAFQVYSSRDYEIPEYQFPTYEACEIHSMSMEFFTYPWMNLFFEEETEKYKFSHLADALLFIPYGVSVDEFQEKIYENPDMTPEERKNTWRGIEKKYLPHKKYGGNDFLEKGGYWQQQRHIYESPFYYIDYTLAQLCAFQYYVWSMENREKAWESYVKLCKLGGSKSFLNLAFEAGLKSPFEDGIVREVVDKIKKELLSVDDSEF